MYLIIVKISFILRSFSLVLRRVRGPDVLRDATSSCRWDTISRQQDWYQNDRLSSLLSMPRVIIPYMSSQILLGGACTRAIRHPCRRPARSRDASKDRSRDFPPRHDGATKPHRQWEALKDIAPTDFVESTSILWRILS